MTARVHVLLNLRVKRRAGAEHRAINTRIYEGTNQTRGDGHRLQCRPPGADTAAADQMGVDVGGGTDPVSPHCSMCYSAEVDLQQTDRPNAL
jgi:hypothetical protein